MRLHRAFGIQGKEVVSFVGGGGKTTAMFRLAGELSAQGKRVVTTTTTRIFAAQIKLAPFHIVAESHARVIKDVRNAIRDTPHILVVGAQSDDGKAFGIDAGLVNELIGLDEIDIVLIEADGSRMRPFKAPAEHEPVIPQTTTLLVPVVGMDVVGKSLDSEHVHRAEIVARVAGLERGTILRPEHIARVLAHEQGGLKNKPASARVIPLINKVENDRQMADARRIASELLQYSAVHAVAIGAVQNLESPISMRPSRIAAIILAAGGSRRMQGEMKQLLPWGDMTLVQNAVRTAHASGVSEIVVVTGNRAEQVMEQISALALREGPAVRCVVNPEWATGRASSVRAGIRALDAIAEGAIFINADQPFLTAPVIDAILEKFFATGAPIVVPTYGGKTGSPVLFTRSMFHVLNALEGEQGGRDVLQRYHNELREVDIADPRAAVDLNTPEDYDRARRMRRGGTEGSGDGG